MVLGPRESIAAMAQHMVELLDGSRWTRDGDPSQTERIRKVGAPVDDLREQVLFAYLMYGPLDATAGMYLFDWYIRETGFSRREFFGDFSSESTSPFSHELESSLPAYPSETLKLDVEARRRIAPEVVEGLKLAGFKSFTSWFGGPTKFVTEETVVDEMEALVPLDDGTRRFPGTMAIVGRSAAGSLARAIDLGVPLLSRTMAAPSWINSAFSNSQLQVCKVVFDQISWLPRPKTFREATAMGADEHLVQLRSLVGHLTEKLLLGDFQTAEELSGEIRKTVEAFRRKPWAARTGAFLTYVSLPLALGEALVGTPVVGISTATVGTALQAISDRVEASRRRHWLSMKGSPFDSP